MAVVIVRPFVQFTFVHRFEIEFPLALCESFSCCSPLGQFNYTGPLVLDHGPSPPGAGAPLPLTLELILVAWFSLFCFPSRIQWRRTIASALVPC